MIGFSERHRLKNSSVLRFMSSDFKINKWVGRQGLEP
jgi:hypothetical protein